MYFRKPSKTHATGLLAWTDTNQSLHRQPRLPQLDSHHRRGKVGASSERPGSPWNYFFVLAMALDTHCHDFELARGLINKN